MQSKDGKAFRKIVCDGIKLAAGGENMVAMGIAPAGPETGYGYIEAGEERDGLYRVNRFTEKPNQQRANEFLAAGKYYWNSGMFLCSAESW